MFIFNGLESLSVFGAEGNEIPRDGFQSLARGFTLAILFLLFAGATLADPPDDPAADEPPAEETLTGILEDILAERHRRWLADVAPLITDVEREVFLGLAADYRRDAFIRRFWRVRDPFPSTPRNELEERWDARVETARELFDDLDTERARMLLVFGEPSRRFPISCEVLQGTPEVWIYDEGSPGLVGGTFTLVFEASGVGRDRYRLWRALSGLRSLVSGALGAGRGDAELASRIRRACARGDDLLAALAQHLDVDRLRDRGPLFPTPGPEWVRTFQSRTTEPAEGVAELPGRLEISFPGRHQNRTVVQGLVVVPKAELGIAELGDVRAVQFLVDGEILRQGELFEQFRYRFGFPADALGEEVPLVVQRYLRPGDYQLVLEVEDVPGQKVFHVERELVVPRYRPRETAVAVDEEGNVREVPLPAGSAESSSTRASASPDEPPEVYAARLAEANASISTGDHVVEIVGLPETLAVGPLRVQARARGEGIAAVAFELNGQRVMTKRRAPYSVELNLGDAPRLHVLRAVALDDEGQRLAEDEVLVNGGPHRFDIRLLEPRRGRVYRESVRVHAEVEVPEDERLDRVELYLDETLVATLYQPPFEQAIFLPNDEMTFVRAAAFLDNGEAVETVELINAPDVVEEVRVNFVELYASILDRNGAFVEGLDASSVTVFEDGVEQTVRRFEPMHDQPIRAGLVIDTSLSMLDALPDVEKAAYGFLESVLGERDRAAVVTFADEPRLAVRFTGDRQVLAGGLVGLVAEGETALWDSVIFTLHYFSGMPGKRAIIVLTDGEDSTSRYSFSDAIEFARRVGVAVYVVGLQLPTHQTDVRLKINRLARETGGEVFFIDRVRELDRVYARIEEELRSQYLIAYQSNRPPKEGVTDEFRLLEVRAKNEDLEVKTIPGYFP